MCCSRSPGSETQQHIILCKIQFFNWFDICSSPTRKYFFSFFDSLFCSFSQFSEILLFLSLSFYEFLWIFETSFQKKFTTSLPQLELKTSIILNKISGWRKGKSFSLLIFVPFAVKNKNFLIFVAHAFPARKNSFWTTFPRLWSFQKPLVN